MANTIKIKRKTTAGPPLIGDLVDGEMCLVAPDQTLYMRVDASNLIVVNKLPLYISTAVPSQVIPVNNIAGTAYGTPEWNATYILGALVVGSITKVAIDTTGQTVFPTITGATLRTGAAFVAAETFDMVVVTDDGTNAYYYFLSR